MPLAAGARLGPYEILGAIGAGGMGEVYKARDTRLNRTVAIKVLPSDVAGNPDLRSRFEREARAVAALDHPHICGIYDVGSVDGTHYIVMPHLEGQTLAARLEKGPLPLDQALKIAAEIADALDKAHLQGIVHRDLKPANIMLTRSGSKLLDFGLAKLTAPAGPISMSAMTQMATAAPATAHGLILGTVQDMAPEQVEGKEADARSDIWALGAVLYEMVSGTRPFRGDTPASVIGAILKDQPPLISTSQPLAPRTLDHLVSTCLAKEPDQRWQSAADVASMLSWIAQTWRDAITAPGDVRDRPERWRDGWSQGFCWSRSESPWLDLGVSSRRTLRVSRSCSPSIHRPDEHSRAAGLPFLSRSWLSLRTAATWCSWPRSPRDHRFCGSARSQKKSRGGSRAPRAPKRRSGRPTAGWWAFLRRAL